MPQPTLKNATLIKLSETSRLEHEGMRVIQFREGKNVNKLNLSEKVGFKSSCKVIKTSSINTYQ